MIRRCLLGLVLLLGGRPVSGEQLIYRQAGDWAGWEQPYGLLESRAGEGLAMVRFRKEVNAVADARTFTHTTLKRGEVAGGIWGVGSGKGSADRAIDGDAESIWQPDPADPLVNWFIDIDLGRAVLAREIRLLFPDREGARPLRQFTVFASDGARIRADDDLFKFDTVYRTTRPNDRSRISIPLEYVSTDSTVVVDAGMEIDAAYENRYRVVQYISIEVDEMSPDAALAEVEVLTVGDNLSLGTDLRGSFINGKSAVDAPFMFDGDMNSFFQVNTSLGNVGWEEGGVWWGVDLGATFFIDQFFVYYQARGEGLSSFIFSNYHAGPGHVILYSAGERSINSSLPTPQALDYTELLTHWDPNGEGLFRIRYLFTPRRMRYLFWHGVTDQWWGTRALEFMMFSEGYPAQVSMRSGFTNLGELAGDGRPKVIKSLSWDADLPPGTRIQLRSRSGNAMEPVYTFYDKKGDAVTEAQWNSLPKVIRGGVDTTLVVGNDWDEWSNIYQVSGEGFKSASPRRFVQLELILSTDDPEKTPTVRSLSLEYEDALVQEARGRVLPRNAAPNEQTRFTYTLWPRVLDEKDQGFGRLRLTVPGGTGPGEEIGVEVGGQRIEPQRVAVVGDALFIDLPEPVREDSVEISFSTRVVDNATVFSLDLGAADQPGLWQSVEAVDRHANTVFLPALAGSDRLIGDLAFSSPVVTPNGDGINDRIEISFVAFKVQEGEPRVQIFDLGGRLVADLAAAEGTVPRRYTWSGRDAEGELVEPGIYLCRIDLDAESGQDTATRVISVAF